jgi:hemerythrin-like domain-containing protein
MPNAITMLKADHVAVKRLLRELNATSDRAVKQRTSLVEKIERELKTHAQLEEEIFYPAFKNLAQGSDSEEMFYEATEEHHVVDMVLPALKAANPKSPEFKAKAKVLMDLIEHHVEEEEGEMFKEARELFGDAELRQLGDTMLARRETIEAMWDSPLMRPVKKLQSAAHKLMPTKVKNVKASVIGKAMERKEAR